MAIFELVTGPMRAGKTTYASNKQNVKYICYDGLMTEVGWHNFDIALARIIDIANASPDDNFILDGWFSMYNQGADTVRYLQSAIKQKVVFTVMFTEIDTILSLKRQLPEGAREHHTRDVILQSRRHLISMCTRELLSVEFSFRTRSGPIDFYEFVERVRAEGTEVDAQDIDNFLVCAAQRERRADLCGDEPAQALVSIVMPVYNHVEFVGEAIEDLLNQTYSNLEIILVNDGSTDGSLNVLRQYAAKDNRITCLSKNHDPAGGGPGSALNLGFNAANGKYVTWASSDDRKYSDYVETLAGCLSQNPNIEMVFSSFRLSSPDCTGPECVFFPNVPPGETIVVENFMHRMAGQCITGICFMYTRDLKRRAGPFVLMPGEDYVMGVKMGALSNVAYVRKILGAHRSHPKSLTVINPNCVSEANRLAIGMANQYLMGRK